MQQPFFMPGKRKYLFCVDQQGISLLFPIIKQVIDQNLPFELQFLGENIKTHEYTPVNLRPWLSMQKMGSYLYIAGTWEMVFRVKSIAEENGFSEEEIQWYGCGPRTIRVFCCKCHGISETIEQSEITCCHCDLKLSISDHYSRFHHAFLGYVANL